MRSSERRRALLDHIRGAGYVGASKLPDLFGVDSSTIRRDLAQLERAGLIKRTHGGVLPAEPGAVIDTPYQVREQENLTAKQAIGRAAVGLVEDGQTVILDNGSTVYQVAVELRHRKNLNIVTNDLLIGLQIASQQGNRLHMTGGVLLDTVYTLVGPATVKAFEGLHADWAFLGAEAVDVEAGITNINVVELPVKHAMMAATARTVFVVDSSKIGRRAFATVCPVSAAHMIITDDALPADRRAPFGSRIFCAPSSLTNI